VHARARKKGSVRGLSAQIVRWPILLVIVALSLAFVYRMGPSRRKPQWRWITWGSVFAAIAWVAVSILFSWHAENLGSYNKTYGSLGAVVAFMFWMWLSTAVIMIGAELNAEMEHQTVRDTTTGRPKPMGARGATMADTVGAAQG
jgi:membrane protein